jgi:hypothetical protein
MEELMYRNNTFWSDNWEQQYRQELSRDVKDAMVLKALSIIVQELQIIKQTLGIGEDE